MADDNKFIKSLEVLIKLFSKYIYVIGPWLVVFIVDMIIWCVLSHYSILLWLKILSLFFGTLISLLALFHVPKGDVDNHNICIMLVTDSLAKDYSFIDSGIVKKIENIEYVNNNKINEKKIKPICPNVFARYAFIKLIGAGYGDGLSNEHYAKSRKKLIDRYLHYLAVHKNINLIVFGEISSTKNNGSDYYRILQKMEFDKNNDDALQLNRDFTDVPLSFDDSLRENGLNDAATVIDIFVSLVLVTDFVFTNASRDQFASFFSMLFNNLNRLTDNDDNTAQACSKAVHKCFNQFFDKVKEDVKANSFDSENFIINMIEILDIYLKFCPNDISALNDKMYYKMEYIGKLKNITFEEYKTEVRKILAEYSAIPNDAEPYYSLCASKAYLNLIAGNHDLAEYYFNELYKKDIAARSARADAYAYYRKNMNNTYERIYALYSIALYKYYTSSDLGNAKRIFEYLSKNKKDSYIARKSGRYMFKICVKHNCVNRFEYTDLSS